MAVAPIEALYRAVCELDHEAARAALEAGADPNARLAAQDPLVLCGFTLPDDEMLDLLLRAGLDPRGVADAEGGGVVHRAANAGRVGALARFVAVGCDPHREDGDGRAPIETAAPACFDWLMVHTRVPQAVLNRMLHRALGGADLDRLRRLLAAGADPEAPGPGGLHPLFSGGGYGPGGPRLQLLLEAGADPVAARGARGATVMHAAAARGSPEDLERLVSSGCDPEAADDDGRRPADVATGEALAWFSARGLLPRRRREALLIAALDDPRAWDAAVRAGARPTPHVLRRAIEGRDLGSVSRVLESAPGLASQPGSAEALCDAARLGEPEICARLLEAGADPAGRGPDGTTPLHCAVLAQGRDPETIAAIVELLLAHGAEPLATDDHGTTPRGKALAASLPDRVLALLPGSGREDATAAGVRRARLYRSGPFSIWFHPHRSRDPFELEWDEGRGGGGGFFCGPESLRSVTQREEVGARGAWLEELAAAFASGEVGDYAALRAFARARGGSVDPSD